MHHWALHDTTFDAANQTLLPWERCSCKDATADNAMWCSNCLTSLMAQQSSFTCLQRDQLVMFEKVLHTSYSFLLASIVRVMFHKMQHMMARLMHDHVVVEVPSKDRKALLDSNIHDTARNSANICDHKLKMPFSAKSKMWMPLFIPDKWSLQECKA